MVFIVKVPGVNHADIFGVNGDKDSSGCRDSGNLVLQALRKEIFLNENGKPVDFEKLELEEIHLNNNKPEEANKLIYENAFESFEVKEKVIFLGGDSSISYSLTRAFFDFCLSSSPIKEPCLIMFDAHADLIDSSNKKAPHNRAWLKQLIEDGFPVKNILLVGTRNFEISELEFINKHNLRRISMNQLLNDLEDTCDIIMEFSRAKELYLSLDIDIIDPAFAPDVGYPEFGGLTSRQFIYLIQRMNKIKNLRAIDLTEINSENKEKNSSTIKLGAKILSELI